jgi:GT2 family glycosyltransferase
LQRLPIRSLGTGHLLSVSDHPDRLLLHTPPPHSADHGLSRITINLERPPRRQKREWLDRLRGEQAIWDPDPARVCLMRALGLPAHWLDPLSEPNGWLSQQAASDPHIWATALGLAPPTRDGLIVLGRAGKRWDRALAREASTSMRLRSDSGRFPHPIDYRPGWFSLISSGVEAALAQAGWLAAAAHKANALIWIQANVDANQQLMADAAATLLIAQPPLTPDHVRSRLTSTLQAALVKDRPSPATAALLLWRWHQKARRTLVSLLLEGARITDAVRGRFTSTTKPALAEDRPPPPASVLFEWRLPQAANAAVVVSLFNYRDRITDALSSVVDQSQPLLELVVVDDASDDDGAEVVRGWMQEQLSRQHHPFVRMALIRHSENAGLAATRNTGFHWATASWCFVLDADNRLYPEAVAACLTLAEQGPDSLAVVHPLIAVEAEPGVALERRSLVATASWQREMLAQGNTVDAMALVRRSAWQTVGEYTHIEGGWEDYDFWCKLIHAGFHGVQCPRLLAVYRSHPSSMSNMRTNSEGPSLKRTLQLRHPWLQLQPQR